MIISAGKTGVVEVELGYAGERKGEWEEVGSDLVRDSFERGAAALIEGVLDVFPRPFTIERIVACFQPDVDAGLVCTELRISGHRSDPTLNHPPKRGLPQPYTQFYPHDDTETLLPPHGPDKKTTLQAVKELLPRIRLWRPRGSRGAGRTRPPGRCCFAGQCSSGVCQPSYGVAVAQFKVTDALLLPYCEV
jgi:hypothetical protein